jgi:hypothetical protein
VTCDWSVCRARNDSYIVDHFQGLLKSTLDCPNCGHNKRKFDPFMYLSVPLPGADLVLHEFTLMAVDGRSRPQNCCVKVHKHDNVGAFLEAVAELAEIGSQEASERLCAALWSGSKLTVYDDRKAEMPVKRACVADKDAHRAVHMACLSQPMLLPHNAHAKNCSLSSGFWEGLKFFVSNSC